MRVADAYVRGAPRGVDFVRYVIRYKLHIVNALYMKEMSTGHQYFLDAPSVQVPLAAREALQKIQDKLNNSLQPVLNKSMTSSSSQAQSETSINDRPGRLEL